MQNKSVVVVGNPAEHRCFGFDDLLYAVSQANRIVVSFAVDDNPMCDTANLEIDLFEVADFDR